MSDRGLLIIIPAFNESSSISGVVRQSRKYGHVVVLDDGSSDTTREMALEAGAEVVSNVVNLGYEKTLSLGFQAALADSKFNYLITLDGDGEHNPVDIETYFGLLVSGCHLVCGERSVKNRFSEEVWGWFVARMYGISDPLCGFKGYSLEFIRNTKISAESEVLGGIVGTRLMREMLALKCNRKNVEIKVAQRMGKSKFGVGVMVNLKILISLVRFLRAPIVG